MSVHKPLTALLLGAGEPAKGAPLDQVVIATLAATAATAAVIWVGMAHRSGRITWLSRLAAFTERMSSIPGWAALPAFVAGMSQLVAVFGFYWDVAKHIDTGRDPGPFGTPAHYPILVGLFGIALAGVLAITLGAPKQQPSSVRIGRGWHAPLGGLLIFLCGGVALTGFPLDDIWHRLFGQDVTLWGPTHIQMVGGASLTTLAVWMLLVEGRRARQAPARNDRFQRFWLAIQGPSIAGAFLIGLSTLQGEFDYGVPQFQLVYQPILIALAASIGLVTARIVLGRGGALQAALFYMGVFGLLALVVGPVFGLSTLHFPLYIVEALVVELVAWWIGSRRPLLLGAGSGALIGTVGLGAEWGWSHLWMPLPWPTSLLPQAVILGLASAVAGGILGGFIGRALSLDRDRSAPAPSWLAPAAGVVAVACIAFPLPMTAGAPVTASVSLQNLSPPPNQTVAAEVRLSPPEAAKGSQWLTANAWQGGGLVVDRLKPIGPGLYRTTQPIPVHGNWKAMLRLENGRALRATPIYLPADPAIPAPQVAATQRFERSFVTDKQILQRETLAGSQGLKVPAYLTLISIAAAWLFAIAWCLRRLEQSGAKAETQPQGAQPERFHPRTPETTRSSV